jgi:hypothetical protein
MAIAFLPIDIDVRLPDEEKLFTYCERYKLPKIKDSKDTVEYWDLVPVIGRLSSEQWQQIEFVRNVLYNRYNPRLGECQWANNIDKEFPEIPYMLAQLPFKELTMVTMMIQKTYVPHHMDPHQGDVYLDPSEISIDNEPHRYNIQLTQHGKAAYFVSQTHDGEKIFPKITREQPCFAFCERYHCHGSEYIGPNKIQLSVFGIVDRQKHKDTIIKNLARHKDEAIIFPNPDDPSDLKYHFDKYSKT